MKNSSYNTLVKEMYGSLKNNVADYIKKYADTNPDGIAIIEHATGQAVSWAEFEQGVNFFAGALLARGFKKGDIIATNLPLTREHIYLIYGCYRTGIIVAPLDLRLTLKELRYCFDKMRPAAYFFLGRPYSLEFRETMAELLTLPYVTHWVQVQKEEEGIVKGALSLGEFLQAPAAKEEGPANITKARELVGKRDPCLIIFTTGSTGSPKAALLCHENIMIQNIGIAVGFEINEKDRMLVNLPTSHVGCVTEQLGTILFIGGTAVILPIFDPQNSLEAIQQHQVTYLGQIPALFNVQWKLSNYQEYDLSSLKFAIYGGQAVSREFLEKLNTMAPHIGTGLGLTELAGFCTYTDLKADVDELSQGIGYDSPLCPVSIREAMNDDGTAGREKKPGEIGEICFSGPQVFPGYLNDEESTRTTVSRDGVCYTGDLGSYDDKGLHFAGRAKMVIKPKGFQVFPEDIENHILQRFTERAAAVACLGFEHEIYGEAIMAFVENVPDGMLSTDEIKQACREISSYARPSHIEIVDPGTIPLNRVGKTDYMTLKEQARGIVEKLREKGRWDKRR